jgi:predicted transcriptional regulator
VGKRSIRFEEDLENKLEKRAEALNSNFTNVVKRACDHWLDFQDGRQDAIFQDLRPFMARFVRLEHERSESNLHVQLALEGAQVGFQQRQGMLIDLLRHACVLGMKGPTEQDKDGLAEILTWVNELDQRVRKPSSLSDNG